MAFPARESREQHDRRARRLQQADARRRAQQHQPVTSVTRQVDPFALITGRAL